METTIDENELKKRCYAS